MKRKVKKVAKDVAKVMKVVKEYTDYLPNVNLLQSKDIFSDLAKIMAKVGIHPVQISAGDALSSHMESDAIFALRSPKDGDVATDVITVIVGKAVVYDTGGYNIKTSGMKTMNHDKAGAAATIGAIALLPKEHQATVRGCIAPRINLLGQILPGTIVKSVEGVKVEIDNTDAEGRLVLADQIEAVMRMYPKVKNIITIATLTGVASYIGNEQYSLVMTSPEVKQKIANNLAKLEELKIALTPDFEKAGTPMSRRCPKVRSNSCNSHKGTGADQGYKFLRSFVPKHVNHIHLDIAGVAATATNNATGYGVEQLHYLLEILK